MMKVLKSIFGWGAILSICVWVAGCVITLTQHNSTLMWSAWGAYVIFWIAYNIAKYKEMKR